MADDGLDGGSSFEFALDLRRDAALLRARRILEELRRRFGENFRPQLELEYIERLLRDF